MAAPIVGPKAEYSVTRAPQRKISSGKPVTSLARKSTCFSTEPTYPVGTRFMTAAMASVNASDRSWRAARQRAPMACMRWTGSAMLNGIRNRCRVIRFPPGGSPGLRMLIGTVTVSSSAVAPCRSW